MARDGGHNLATETGGYIGKEGGSKGNFVNQKIQVLAICFLKDRFHRFHTSQCTESNQNKRGKVLNWCEIYSKGCQIVFYPCYAKEEAYFWTLASVISLAWFKSRLGENSNLSISSIFRCNKYADYSLLNQTNEMSESNV